MQVAKEVLLQGSLLWRDPDVEEGARFLRREVTNRDLNPRHEVEVMKSEPIRRKRPAGVPRDKRNPLARLNLLG